MEAPLNRVLLQWNLCITKLLGQVILFIMERFPFFGGYKCVSTIGK